MNKEQMEKVPLKHVAPAKGWSNGILCTAEKPIPKIRNKYTQKRNCASTVPIFTFMCMYVTDLCIQYISTIDLPILLQEICGPILEIYKSIRDTWMWKLGLRPRNSQERNSQLGFSLQCMVSRRGTAPESRRVQDQGGGCRGRGAGPRPPALQPPPPPLGGWPRPLAPASPAGSHAPPPGPPSWPPAPVGGVGTLVSWFAPWKNPPEFPIQLLLFSKQTYEWRRIVALLVRRGLFILFSETLLYSKSAAEKRELLPSTRWKNSRQKLSVTRVNGTSWIISCSEPKVSPIFFVKFIYNFGYQRRSLGERHREISEEENNFNVVIKHLNT